EDPRFRSQLDRASNQAVIKELLEEVFRTNDASTWLEQLAAAGVPCAPINSTFEALADPQVQASGWVQPLELPGGGKTRTFAWPVGISGRPRPAVRRPPALDEHGDEIRAGLSASARASSV